MDLPKKKLRNMTWGVFKADMEFCIIFIINQDHHGVCEEYMHQTKDDKFVMVLP